MDLHKLNKEQQNKLIIKDLKDWCELNKNYSQLSKVDGKKKTIMLNSLFRMIKRLK